MSDKITPKMDLESVQKYCAENKVKVPWNKILSIGIYSELKAILPEGFITSNRLYQALGHHVHSVSYLKRMAQGADRYSLGYVKSSTVTLTEARRAKDTFFKLHMNKKPKVPKAPRRKKKVAGPNTLRLKRG